jgi:transcriptional regulator with XRE-family HTH domain
MSHPSNLYQQIGKQIQELRRKKGITQSKLADSLALNRTSITNIEKGRQKILVHTLWDLADALGVPLKNLLPEETSFARTSNEPKFPPNVSKEEAKWVETVIKGGQIHGDPEKND